jgi:hypothetical protein
MLACCLKGCPVVCIRWKPCDKAYWLKHTGWSIRLQVGGFRAEGFCLDVSSVSVIH